jgi:protein O-mannosyl-transferase
MKRPISRSPDKPAKKLAHATVLGKTKTGVTQNSGCSAVTPLIPVWLMVGLFVTLMVLVYMPSLRGPPILDDDGNLTNNITLRSGDGLALIWGKLTASPQYYPLVYTSFWLEYHLWGLQPLGYHFVNVLLHSLAVILLWRVLVRLQLPGAWLAAGIFALHPVMVESVAWMTERKNVLSGVFYFAAALAYLKHLEPGVTRIDEPGMESASHGSARWYFIAFALFLAALLSKTATCTLPAALLLILWWKRGSIRRCDMWPLLPFFGAAVGMGLVTSWLERTHVGAQGPDWAFSWAERVLIAGRAVWFYAGKIFWPVGLAFSYPRWVINPSVWWQWMFPISAAVVVVVLWCLRNRIGRGAVVAVLYFGGTLFPVLGFNNVYFMRFTFVADHFQYLASVGLIVLAVASLAKIFQTVRLAAVVLLLGLGILSWQQARIYADEKILWQDTLSKNPDSILAHYNLGTELIHRGQLDEAIIHLQAAIRLQPSDPKNHENLGLAFLMKGQLEEALVSFQTAQCLDPDASDVYNNQGIIRLKMGQLVEATQQFREAIRLKPDYAAACYNLGNAYVRQGQFNQAIQQFQATIRLKPDYVEARYNLGNAYVQQGKFNQAILQFQEAIRLKPDYAEAHTSLGITFDKTGQISEAISQYQAALQLKPDDGESRNNLGVDLGMAGQLDEAIRQFREALRLKPGNTDVSNNLAHALLLKNPPAGR